MKGKILVVDDDKSMTDVLSERLKRRQFEVTAVQSVAEARVAFDAAEPDVVVTDLNMPGQSGSQFCEWVATNRGDVPVIVITAFGSLDTAIAAIRAGAYDFITKPFEIDVLAIALERAIKHRQLRHEVTRLRSLLDATRGLSELLGESPVMKELKELMVRVAGSQASVLITGESGTGKEVVARLLHQQGPRAEHPFVALNCAAMPEHLIESELFGHVRGAFTDAKTDKVGLLVQAHQGTLFLDEIGDMPMSLQPKLLRVLEERKVRPVGGGKEVSFDVRLISATNRDLEDATAQGQFREDLYFRLNVIQIALPPLRARGGDVLLIAQSFVDAFAKQASKAVQGLSPEAAERLLTYAWPGNVRELRNAIERAVALTQHERITVDDLPERIRAYKVSHVLVASQDPEELVNLAEVEKRYIARVLGAVGGNKSTAAKILGIDRTTLYKKLQQYKIS
ncbi:MAG TPA: sigma-54 dependent transcriptional regulator [Polyangiaceae bacterium]|nr:sigma-54 dependent transcriptional regulator [Polyangiaceae bacterium]